ncbi:hypothetical protein Cflav_PD2345 [Pedosphaera parvula Ellin514]|uniref:Zinc-ribbon domain-containing protein n=1 Tax=Pedosphaera parvula (strain Ellin514) TaxID=320771 RepID=B9XL07_PEDPL|nr:hypothetical protein Cflav_PD2345 [Pedosphaera parvula Ellin514]
MASFNMCGYCGHRISDSLTQCKNCGSTACTKNGKKILSGLFFFFAVLLIVFISWIL